MNSKHFNKNMSNSIIPRCDSQMVDAVNYLTAFSELEPRIYKYLCEQGRLFREKGFNTFDEFLKTDDGLQWLSGKKGFEWLVTDVGIDWLSSATGREWLTEDELSYVWLSKNHKYGCDILKQESDFEWFVNSKNGMNFCKINVVGEYFCYDSYCGSRMCDECKLHQYLAKEDFLSSPAGICYGIAVVTSAVVTSADDTSADDTMALYNLFVDRDKWDNMRASKFFEYNIRNFIKTDGGKQWLYGKNSFEILQMSEWGFKFLKSQCEKPYNENNKFVQSECFKQLVESVKSAGTWSIYYNTPIISGYVSQHPDALSHECRFFIFNKN